MSNPNKFTDQMDRRVVPRWRASKDAAISGETSPLRAKSQLVSFEGDLARVRHELAESPTPGVAADALGIALLAGDTELAARAKRVLSSNLNEIPSRLRELVETEKGSASQIPISHTENLPSDSGQEIHRIRALVRQYPKSPLHYLDLARSYATLGQHEKAERAVSVALTLAPGHRHVLRASSRFYITNDQPDVAHRLLVKSEATKYDPWLISAEISAAQVANKSSKFWREGKNMIERKTFGPEHLSELACAIGTQEILDGKRRDAKRSFEVAVISPTENALAQIKWAEKKSNLILPKNNLVDRLPGAYEAAFIRAYYHEQDVVAASNHVAKWFVDEPYSPVPAMMASYMNSLMDDYGQVIKTCDLALIANPDNDCLINNRLYALMSNSDFFSGDPAEVELRVSDAARKLVHLANQPGADKAHIGANFGLLLYRAGYLDEGRNAYDRTIKSALSRGEYFAAVHAAIFHAREAILSRTGWADLVWKETQDLMAKHNVGCGAAFYAAKLRSLAANPDKAGEILNPATAKNFLQKKAPSKLGLELKVMNNPDGTITLVVPHRLLR